MPKINPETTYRISGIVTLDRVAKSAPKTVKEPEVQIKSDPVSEFEEHVKGGQIENDEVIQEFDNAIEGEVVKYWAKPSDAELIQTSRSTVRGGVFQKSSAQSPSNRLVEVTGQAARDIIAICKNNKKIKLVIIKVGYHSA